MKNKKVPTAEIENMLRAISPDLIDWNPTDEEYQLVKWSEIAGMVKRFPASGWIENKWECEEIARAFVVDVRREEAQDKSQTLNRAIGVANCSKLQGEETNHTIDILITDRGVALLDMQTGSYWLAERGQDEFYFVEM